MRNADPSRRVESIYAFLMNDEQFGEGFVIARVPRLGALPLLEIDMDGINKIRGLAQEMANKKGTSIRLTVFSKRTDLEEIKPIIEGEKEATND